MPFDGSGTFDRIYDWTDDRDNGVKIRADRFDAEMDGMATGLSTCITKDGQTTITANIPMNSFKFTGLAAGTAAGQSVRYEQVREKLASTRNYYVRADGSDSNTGLANTAGAAFLTIQKAVDVIQQLDCAGNGAAINIGAGTFTGAVRVNGLTLNIGTNGIQFIGAGATTIISVTSNDAISAYFGAHIRLDSMKIQTTTTGDGVASYFDSLVELGSGVEFGACAYSHIVTGTGGKVFATSAYTISGGATSHWHASGEGAEIVLGSQTITLTGTPAFSSYFCGINKGSVTCTGVTFSGSATGKRFVVHYNGTMDTGLLNALTYFPGNSAGTFENGAVIVSSEGDRIDPQSAWKTYTPTITAGTGTFTSVSAAGEYKMDGKIGHLHVLITVTTVGTASGHIVVPFPSGFVATNGAFVGGINKDSSNPVAGYCDASGTGLAVFCSTAFPSSGHRIHLSGTLEVN